MLRMGILDEKTTKIYATADRRQHMLRCWTAMHTPAQFISNHCTGGQQRADSRNDRMTASRQHPDVSMREPGSALRLAMD